MRITNGSSAYWSDDLNLGLEFGAQANCFRRFAGAFFRGGFSKQLTHQFKKEH